MSKTRKITIAANACNAKKSNHLYSKKKRPHRTKYKIPTDSLQKHEVEQFFKAVRKAYVMDCPLNRFMTFHIDKLADKNKPNQFIIDLMEHGRKWLNQRGLPVAYIYVLENAPIKGIHAHLLIHIPSGYQVDFKRALKRHLPYNLTKPHFDTQTISYPYYGSLHEKNAIYGVVKYMSKGLNYETPLYDIITSYQGKIYGQRYGISSLLR